MEFFGRLHPLLVHFPIALVLVSAGAECAAALGRGARWHTVAVGNLRAAAAFALAAAGAGWVLAPAMEPTAVLEWHRWLGTVAAALTAAAAIATVRAGSGTVLPAWVYRTALLGAGAAVALAGHLGALLVWGADFLRP